MPTETEKNDSPQKESPMDDVILNKQCHSKYSFSVFFKLDIAPTVWFD